MALLITLSLALLATLLDLAPAAGAEVQNLSVPSVEALGPQVAVDARGRAIVVWWRSDGAEPRIQLRRRSTSGTLSTIKTLSEAGQAARWPQVEVDGKGRAIVVWQRHDGAHRRIQLRRRSASGSLGPIQTLSAAGQDADGQQVALDAKGHAFVVWQRSDGADERIQIRRRSASGSLGAVKTLDAGGQDTSSAQVAIDPKGNAIVVWLRFDGAHWRVQLRHRSASGSLGTIQTLSAAGQDAGSPQVAIDAKGNAIVVWQRSDGANPRVQLRRRSASGKLGPVKTLSVAGQSVFAQQVAVDAMGNAIVVWLRFDGAHWRVQLRRRSASGSLGPVQTLSAAGQDAHGPQVAIDGKGNAYVVWYRMDGTSLRVQLRRRSASGTFGKVKTLSAAVDDARFPQVAVGGGNAYIVWRRLDGAGVRIQGTRVPAS